MGNMLFTGFPGFLASNLIKELRQQDAVSKIYVLVLPSQLQKAKEVIEEIGRDGKDIPIIPIEGDITLPNAGLLEETMGQLLKEVEYIWHLAAIYDLAVPKDLAWKVNVHGTDIMNHFALKFPNLKRYMYFSTAYVAGTREGELLETELVQPPSFKNFYEETKYKAEELVELLKEKLPVTIIRPGIVRGDSKTGETIKFDGPYFFINMITKLRKLPFIPYLGRSSSFINVVPCDYITKAAIYCCFSEKAVGKTLHLTDPKPYPVEEIYRAFVKEITDKYPKGRLPLGIAKVALNFYPVRKMLQVEKETIDYVTWNASFDTTVAESILEGKIECPDFLESIPSMIRFYNQHKDDLNFHIRIK